MTVLLIMVLFIVFLAAALITPLTYHTIESYRIHRKIEQLRKRMKDGE